MPPAACTNGSDFVAKYRSQLWIRVPPSRQGSDPSEKKGPLTSVSRRFNVRTSTIRTLRLRGRLRAGKGIRLDAIRLDLRDPNLDAPGFRRIKGGGVLGGLPQPRSAGIRKDLRRKGLGLSLQGTGSARTADPTVAQPGDGMVSHILTASAASLYPASGGRR